MRARMFKLLGVNACKGRGNFETSTALKKFINFFEHRGTVIILIYRDNEFENLWEQMSPIHIETAGWGDYVRDIERLGRVVKDISSYTTSTLPYRHIPRLMININIKDEDHWLNAFAPVDYISKSISPEGLVLRNTTSQVKHSKLYCGQYFKSTMVQTP